MDRYPSAPTNLTPDIFLSGNYSLSTATIINWPDTIPISISGMTKFFFGARPNSKGDYIWAKVYIGHNLKIENIIADTREDLKENYTQLILQSIQHCSVKFLGFFKNLHPDIFVVSFSEYLKKKELNSSHRQTQYRS